MRPWAPLTDPELPMPTRRRLARYAATALTALLALAGLAPTALGAGISLDRSPTPPQAVARGTGTEQIQFGITYATVADRWVLTITDQAGTPVYSQTQSVPGQPSPITGTASWSPPALATPGRYRAALAFYSTTSNPEPESTATVIFDVADQLGTLRLVKYEDLNGNGRVDPGEPQVPGWRFRLVNPQGNASEATTGADGSVTVAGVPAGVWRVEEILSTGWVAISGGSGSVTVPNGGTGTFVAGNARPAPLSGTVFIDANNNGARDAGEQVRGGVTLTLSGTTGLGAPVTATTTSAGDGTYQFPGLLPGTYAVSVAVPTGLTATTVTTRPNRVITSATPNPNNDFGLRTGGGTIAQAPGVTIVKRGPASVRRGDRFTYTVRVRNTSRAVARNVRVTDPVPGDLTLVSVPRGATLRNGVVTWTLGDLAPGASRTLSMRVRVNPTSTVRSVRNTATVTATGLRPRRSTVTTRIPNRPPVRRSGAVTG
jgi:uncharacterized repeat protein (TIGR01451 family)